MRVGNAVVDVPSPEVLEDRGQLLEMVETLHRRREHLHQLLPLLRHVPAEHQFEHRIELEQAPIE